MISEYRLIHKLINLPIYYRLKNNLKMKLLSLLASQPKKRQIINFVFNKVTSLSLFNHVTSLFFAFNHIDSKKAESLINDYNCYLVSQIPIFNFQTQKMPNIIVIQNFFETISFQNKHLQTWLLNDKTENSNQTKYLNFINKNKLIPENIKTKINNLCHVSGSFWNFLASETTIDNYYYDFGYLLMLSYLLFLESEQTIKIQDQTNWNLKAVFNNDQEIDFFLYRLKIINEFSIVVKKMAKSNFNLYFRVINVILNKNYD